MSTLVTADLHLTDNPRDAYRWEVFSKLAKHAGRSVTDIVIAGDLTHSKDNHSNRFINRLVDELLRFANKHVVWVLKGNHDFTDPDYPLLRLAQHIPGLQFVGNPTEAEIGGKKTLLLPYTDEPESAWKGLPVKGIRQVFFHQPVEGAVASGGHAIAGVSRNEFKRWKGATIIGGDIHEPQKLGPVEYVGSPHPVSAGEGHDPHFILIKGTRVTYLPIETIKRSTIKMRRIKSLAKLGVKAGDQVRVKVELPTSRQDQWIEYRDKIKADAEEHGITLLGLEMVPLDQKLQLPHQHAQAATPLDVFREFIAQQQVPDDLVGIGEDLLTTAVESNEH